MKASNINTRFENNALPNHTLHTERTASNEDLALIKQNTSTLNLVDDKGYLWHLPKRGDRVIQIRVSRNTLIAFILSIIIHLLLLITLAPKLLDMGGGTKQTQSFDVQLSIPAPRVAEAPSVDTPSSPPIKPQPIQKPKKQIRENPQPAPKTITKSSTSPEVMTAEKPQMPITKPPMTPALTHNPPPATTEPLPGEDMQAYIKRQKEQRQAAQGYTQKDSDEVNARDNAPISDEDKRTAAIQRNLQPQGGNGIFQVHDMSLRTGRFTFKGWKNDYSKARQRDIDVEVPLGGDLQRAMVKKMIAIIREEYTGDFNWDSRRLGRVITLSARPADNAGLEDFLIEEFFGRGGLVPR